MEEHEDNVKKKSIFYYDNVEGEKIIENHYYDAFGKVSHVTIQYNVPPGYNILVSYDKNGMLQSKRCVYWDVAGNRKVELQPYNQNNMLNMHVPPKNAILWFKHMLLVPCFLKTRKNFVKHR